jgi:hypothetical protein
LYEYLRPYAERAVCVGGILSVTVLRHAISACSPPPWRAGKRPNSILKTPWR